MILVIFLALVDCRSPPLTSGMFTFSSTTGNSVATLSCFLPYALRGQSEYKCSIMTGQWTGNGECG